jgi:hypothetical protein
MTAERTGTEGTVPFDDPDLITRQEAADLLHCGLRSLHYRRKAGDFPAGTVEVYRRRSGGHPLVRYRRSKLEEFLRNDWTVTADVPNASDSTSTLE